MPSIIINRITTRDARFQLKPGEGADAVHSAPQYAYAVAQLHTDQPYIGVGLAFTLGGGNDLVCRAIEALAEPLIGREIEALMAEFGQVMRQIADHHQLRWLGPHKGVVHLALAAICNACFDLWAKARDIPLWRLLLDLAPQQVVALLDLSYTIFRHQSLLFAYFEYIGDNFAADMAIMAADPKTREWWTFTDPMQEPVEGRRAGEWWATMKELFHTD